MKLLRFILVLVVLAYAGWLVWPIVSPFLEGASPGAASMRAGAEAGSQGLPKAAIAYFLGFIADAALRLALDGGRAGSEISARSAEAVGPATSGLGIDPTWLVLGALLVLGGLIVVVSRRRRRHRTPGQLTI